jgi:hypothetical protein
LQGVVSSASGLVSEAEKLQNLESLTATPSTIDDGI